MAQVTIDILGLSEGVVQGTDNYPAVDVKDPLQSPIGTTKRYVVTDLYSFILNNLGVPTLPSANVASTFGYTATYNNGVGGINATLTDATGTFLPFTIDGLPGVVGSTPYLIKNQTNQFENGVYYLVQNGDTVSRPWILIRTFFFDRPSNIINGQIIRVLNGLTQSDTTWELTAPTVVVVGTSNLVFNQISNFTSIFPILRGGFPAIFNLVGPTNVTFPTSGTLATVGQIFPWVEITANTVNLVPNNGYIMNNNAVTILATLPLVAAKGQIIEIAGLGSQGWSVLQNAGQQINYGILSTTPGIGGSLSSTQRYNTVRLLCVVDNLTFNVLSNQGNLTVV